MTWANTRITVKMQGLGETYSATGAETLSQVDTSGAAIALDLGYQVKKVLNSSDTIAAPAVVSVINDAPSLEFTWSFPIDAGVALTLPPDFVMSDPFFAGGVWTPLDAGNYCMTGKYDGTNWIIDIEGPYT